MHGPESRTIDFDALAGELGLVEGQQYPMDIFHAERHTTESNFELELTGFVKRRAEGGGPWQSAHPITLGGYLAVRLALQDSLDADLGAFDAVALTASPESLTVTRRE